MHSTLCLDFGNTRLKYAVFKNNEVIASDVFTSGSEKELMELIKKHQPTHSILSSVIHHDTEIDKLLQKHTKFHLLLSTSKLPITTPVAKPETIGADRLAICAAAASLFPKQHNLVIALGSCITYNFVNKFHEFLGGSISPGMHMRFKALNEHTALLPLIEAEHDFPLVAYDTKTNLLSGVIFGMAKEIEGVINLYNEKYNHLNIILTGGDTNFIQKHIYTNFTADELLLFKGLNAIAECNI